MLYTSIQLLHTTHITLFSKIQQFHMTHTCSLPRFHSSILDNDLYQHSTVAYDIHTIMLSAKITQFHIRQCCLAGFSCYIHTYCFLPKFNRALYMTYTYSFSRFHSSTLDNAFLQDSTVTYDTHNAI